jgi:hypothetical protein
MRPPPPAALGGLFVCAALVSCGDTPRRVGPWQGSAGTLSLQEVARYGWEEAPKSGWLPPEKSALGGGVLGRVTDVVQAPDSFVFVLDADYQKIVGFAPGGILWRVIAGGEGEGPGEFELPIDLAVDSPGRLAVLDVRLGRVTRFTREGELVGVTPLPEPRQGFVLDGDTLWTSRITGALAEQSLGERWLPGDSLTLLDTFPTLLAPDLPYGGGGWIERCPDGRVLVGTRRPGVWMEYDAGAWRRRGDPLFPDMDPPLVERRGGGVTVWAAQADVSGLACLPDGRVLQRFARYTEKFVPRQTPPPQEHFVALFERQGRLISGLRLDETVAAFGPFHVSPVTGHLFMTVSDPFPQVVEFELVHESAR